MLGNYELVSFHDLQFVLYLTFPTYGSPINRISRGLLSLLRKWMRFFRLRPPPSPSYLAFFPVQLVVFALDRNSTRMVDAQGATSALRRGFPNRVLIVLFCLQAAICT